MNNPNNPELFMPATNPEAGTENKVEAAKELSDLEKRNVRRFFEEKITVGTKALEERINNIDGSKKQLNMGLLADVFPKITILIELCDQEDSLFGSASENAKRSLPKYNEFKETLQELKRQLTALETKVLVKGNVALMDKAYVKGRFDQMIEGTYNRIQTIVDTIAPKS